MTNNQNPQVLSAAGRVTIDELDCFIKDVKEFSEKHGVIIQLFNADMIFGKKHLLSAVVHAIRSKEEGRMATNSLEMELFLYTSGERQLKIAIPKIGVKKGVNNIACVVIPQSYYSSLSDDLLDDLFSELHIKRGDELLQATDTTLERFGFSKAELLTVPKDNYQKLILERIALIDIIK